MRFWDSSAIVPLIVNEPRHAGMMAVLAADPAMLVWWAASVEATSAISRNEREGRLSADQAAVSLEALREFSLGWCEITPDESVRRTAERLLRTHPLRAADSLQLAAAIVASGHDPRTLEFVCLDQRLSAAAAREGFSVVSRSSK